MSGSTLKQTNTARRSPRGYVLVISLVAVWAIFGFAAYECAELALDTLSQDRSQEAAAAIRLWLVVAALIAGIIFAALKFACQCVYGLVEVAIAAVMAAELAKTAIAKEPFAALIGLVAIAYIVVRGLENTIKGILVLREKQRRGELLLGPLRD